MVSFVLQELSTFSGAAGTTVIITQPESGWLDLSAFQDIVAWLDLKELTLGGATSVTCAYQTSPTKDDSYFVNMVTPVTLVATTPLTVTKMLMASTNNPLARFIRWQLTALGPVSAWDVSMRICVAANMSALHATIPISAETQTRMIGPTGGLPPATVRIGANNVYGTPASTGWPP